MQLSTLPKILGSSMPAWLAKSCIAGSALINSFIKLAVVEPPLEPAPPSQTVILSNLIFTEMSVSLEIVFIFMRKNVR